MQLRKYCVTVMNHWTPTRCFWTLHGAIVWRGKFGREAHIYKWQDGYW